MPFLKSTPLEDRGADFDNVREASIKGVRDCDIFVGIYGREYSEITVLETREAIKTKKPGLTYVKVVDGRDLQLKDFIEKEVSPEFKYANFDLDDELVPKVKHDLDSQLYRILTEGLGSIRQKKRTAVQVEKTAEKTAETQLASLPPTTQYYIGLLVMAQNDYRQGKFMETTMLATTAVEVALRDAITRRRLPEAKIAEKSGLGQLISIARSELRLPDWIVTLLLRITQNRNRVLHEGLTPSQEETEHTLKSATVILEQLDAMIRHEA